MMQREWRPFSKNALRISLTWLKKVSLAWSDSHLTWFLTGTLKDLVGVLMLANVELSYTWPLHINPFLNKLFCNNNKHEHEHKKVKS